MQEYLTPHQVADLLQVGTHTVWRWEREGTMPFVQAGERARRIGKARLLEWLAERRSQPLETPLQDVPAFSTTSTVAKRLQVTPQTVRRWINEVGLPAYRLPRQLLIADKDLQKWLKTQ